MKKILVLLFCLVLIASKAQLNVQLTYGNNSPDIKDAQAEATVSGGKGSLTYKWSNQATPLTSAICSGMDEGVQYSLLVTDQSGQKAEVNAVVPAESFQEKINALFTPAVQALEWLLFSDPFAAMGLYDNHILDANGQYMYHPNGNPREKKVWLVVVWLMCGAIFFTIRMGFINVRGFKHAIQLARGQFDRPEDKGEVTHFQALATALSGTVGLGNIAGVAVAIAVGGPGATFWMIVAGLFGMSAKFVECTLAVKYRNINDKGVVSGGPMYYLTKGLALRGMGTFGKILAVLFAVLCVGGSLGGGNMLQSNQTIAQIKQVIPAAADHGVAIGIVMALMVGVVIIGGVKRIAKVTDKLVPLMVFIYVGFSLFIIFSNFSHIGDAFRQIFDGAFSPEAGKGGLLGVMIMGFRRAAFSNEAGVGSASIAHSASKTDRPVSEGIVSLLEPFIDTVIICTMTALVLVFTGFAQNPQGLTGSALTNAAFTSSIPWFDVVLMVAIFLFAFSTMISWSYYGVKSWTYLFGETKISEITFKLLFLVCTVIGASSGLGAVMDFSDMMILGMAFPNIIGLLIMSGEVRKDLKQYWSDLKSGVIKKHS